MQSAEERAAAICAIAQEYDYRDVRFHDRVAAELRAAQAEALEWAARTIDEAETPELAADACEKRAAELRGEGKP